VHLPLKRMARKEKGVTVTGLFIGSGAVTSNITRYVTGGISNRATLNAKNYYAVN
jgi:uncharacterized protein (DUF1786 family)